MKTALMTVCIALAIAEQSMPATAATIEKDAVMLARVTSCRAEASKGSLRFIP